MLFLIGNETDLAEFDEELSIAAGLKIHHKKNNNKNKEPAEEQINKTDADAPTPVVEKTTFEIPKVSVPEKTAPQDKPEALLSNHSHSGHNIVTSNQTITEQVKNAVKDIAACAKECTLNCTQGKNLTILETIKCLKDCKCEKNTVESLVQSIFWVFRNPKRCGN